MGRYLLHRVLQMVPLLLGVSVIVFGIIQAAPGGPETALFESGRFIDPEVIEAYRQQLGVDQPIYVQYVYWLMAALQGDLGLSFSTARPVSDVILERIPATLELMLTSFVIAAILALCLGMYSALHKYTVLDFTLTGFSFLGIAMPVFWFGLILQLVFSVKLGWLPVAGTETVGDTSLGDHLAHLILPATVLSFRNVAGWSRYLRSSLLGVVGSDYVRTARAKGLSETMVIGVHAFRNALIPVVSVMALGMADLFSGAVITETIFAWPGIGRLFVQAMFARDYPLLMGILLMGSFMVIVFNLVADILYGLLDPRIRYA